MEKGKLMDSILSNDYAFSLVNKLLSVFIGVFSSVCINRFLGPELKGQYAYLILSFLNDLALVQKRSRICSLKTA